MKAGIPLTDDDRAGWLRSLAARLREAGDAGTGLVLTCSALKRSYRDVLRGGAPDLQFVFLRGPRELIAERLASRRGHFMPASLLDSQFATLEEPSPDEHAWVCDIRESAEDIVRLPRRARNRMTADTRLLLLALGAVIALVVLIARFKWHAFVALIVVSLAMGVAAGMPLAATVKALQDGVGNVLGFIAIVVGLGTMLGKMMAESGAATRIATTLIARFGERRVHWAMMVVAFIVGIPVFFQVGFVLLVPLVFTIARRTGMSLVKIGLPLVAGLSVVHGLLPPHPAAMLAVGAYGADVGRTVLYGIVVGLPTAALAGPMFGAWIAPRITLPAENPIANELAGDSGQETPGFGISVFTVLIPVILMLVASTAAVTLDPASRLRAALSFVGNPIIALLIALLFSFWSLGRARRFTREQILKFCNDCLAPTATILLVIGAGGGFNQVLVASGVGQRHREDRHRLAGVAAHPGVDRGRAHPRRHRLGDGRDDDCRWHRRPDRRRDAGHERGAAGAGDGIRGAGAFARERRRVLADQGVLRHDRPADAEDVDRGGDDHRRRRADIHAAAWLDALRRSSSSRDHRLRKAVGNRSCSTDRRLLRFTPIPPITPISLYWCVLQRTLVSVRIGGIGENPTNPSVRGASRSVLAVITMNCLSRIRVIRGIRVIRVL